MWTLVDEPGDPEAFFACVLPVEREIYQPQYGRAYAALQQGRFDREASVWAMEGREPIGVMLVVGEQPELLVAVREEWRGRGPGRESKTIQNCRRSTAIFTTTPKTIKNRGGSCPAADLLCWKKLTMSLQRHR